MHRLGFSAGSAGTAALAVGAESAEVAALADVSALAEALGAGAACSIGGNGGASWCAANPTPTPAPADRRTAKNLRKPPPSLGGAAASCAELAFNVRPLSRVAIGAEADTTERYHSEATRRGRSLSRASDLPMRYRAAEMSDDDDELGSPLRVDPSKEIESLMDELVSLLKNPDVVGALTSRGINASLALLAVDGLAAYLRGDKQQAADDLSTVAEEIEGRLHFGDDPPSA
jgi:hypothetical protein